MLAADAAVAEETTLSGTITIESHSVALGFGVNWGHGSLKFKGKEYKFKITGLSVVDLGVSNVSATGEVFICAICLILPVPIKLLQPASMWAGRRRFISGKPA